MHEFIHDLPELAKVIAIFAVTGVPLLVGIALVAKKFTQSKAKVEAKAK